MYTATINVRFYETDMMGIAHHSNHFRWFEMARIEFLRHIGVILVGYDGRGYSISNYECIV